MSGLLEQFIKCFIVSIGGILNYLLKSLILIYVGIYADMLLASFTPYRLSYRLFIMVVGIKRMLEYSESI